MPKKKAKSKPETPDTTKRCGGRRPSSCSVNVEFPCSLCGADAYLAIEMRSPMTGKIERMCRGCAKKHGCPGCVIRSLDERRPNDKILPPAEGGETKVKDDEKR